MAFLTSSYDMHMLPRLSIAGPAMPFFLSAEIISFFDCILGFIRPLRCILSVSHPRPPASVRANPENIVCANGVRLMQPVNPT